jgi:hypothetical protein
MATLTNSWLFFNFSPAQVRSFDARDMRFADL